MLALVDVETVSDERFVEVMCQETSTSSVLSNNLTVAGGNDCNIEPSSGTIEDGPVPQDTCTDTVPFTKFPGEHIHATRCC